MEALQASGAKFQFTLPRGERPKAGIIKPSTGAFQFTLPRGERLNQGGFSGGRP